LRHRNPPAGVVGFSILDFDAAVAHVLPFQSRTLFGAKAAINQDGCHVAEQGRCFGEIPLFLSAAQNALTTTLARKHSHPREHLLDLAPFLRDMEHAAEHLKLAIDAGDLNVRLSPLRDIAGDLFSRNGVELLAGDFGIAEQTLHSVLVVGPRVTFLDKRRSDVREKIVGRKIFERRTWDSIPDADLALRQGGFVRGFDLFSDALVRLFGALPDRLSIPGEPVPPDPAAFVNTHRFTRPPSPRAMTLTVAAMILMSRSRRPYRT
jgi:hypothetical protein